MPDREENSRVSSGSHSFPSKSEYGVTDGLPAPTRLRINSLTLAWLSSLSLNMDLDPVSDSPTQYVPEDDVLAPSDAIDSDTWSPLDFMCLDALDAATAEDEYILEWDTYASYLLLARSRVERRQMNDRWKTRRVEPIRQQTVPPLPTRLALGPERVRCGELWIEKIEEIERGIRERKAERARREASTEK